MSEQKISNTAFLVNYMRHKHEKLSGDNYAHLWLDSCNVEEFQLYEKEVNSLESFQLALRHRYFLDKIQTFIQSQPKSVIVNLGAGFTSYPFLIDANIPFCEVDMEHVIQHKSNRIKDFITKGALPKRKVNYLSSDLNDLKSVYKLGASLKEWVGDSPSLIYAEGLIYYLKNKSIELLLSQFKEIQNKGSMLILNYWKPDYPDNQVFQKWMKFAKKRYHHEEFNYTYHDKDYFKHIEGYTVMEYSDYRDLENKFSNTELLQDTSQIFPEDFVVLVRA